MTLDLPSRYHAVALASIGYKPLHPRCSRNDRTGKMSLTWCLSARQQEAQLLIDSIASEDPSVRLSKKSPEDSLLVALYYLANRDAVIGWIRTGIEPLTLPAGPGSRLCRLMPDSRKWQDYDLRKYPQPEAVTISNPSHAAIAITCGFVPIGIRMIEEGPAIQFAATSQTFTGLTIEALAAIRIDSPAPNGTIGRYAPGDHPACICIAAELNDRNFAAAEILSAKNPAHQFKARGKGSAIMSENLIRSKNPFYRDSLTRHLATY